MSVTISQTCKSRDIWFQQHQSFIFFLVFLHCNVALLTIHDSRPLHATVAVYTNNTITDTGYSCSGSAWISELISVSEWITTPLVVFFLTPTTPTRRRGFLKMSTAWVVVLGDAGRSPRMQYHTLSLCRYFGEQVGTC